MEHEESLDLILGSRDQEISRASHDCLGVLDHVFGNMKETSFESKR